jgi:hypothetical protein
MKQDISALLDSPAELEKLFRQNEKAFKEAFLEIYPTIQQNSIAQFWFERLSYDAAATSSSTPSIASIWKPHLGFVLLLCFIAGTVLKLPAIFNFVEENFYPKNVGFVLFPTLIAFFGYKNKLPNKKWKLTSLILLTSIVFVNLLPDFKVFSDTNSTLLLSCIHLPLFLWALLGYVFTAEQDITESRLRYLRFNGDIIILIAVILTVGGMLVGITVGLFQLIGIDITEFYIKYVVLYGLASAPIVAAYLLELNPNLVSRVSPVIARVFSPLVLLTLISYLIALLFSKKDPFNDRDFLLFFNLLLIGVLAIIFFAIVEGNSRTQGVFQRYILAALSIVTIIVNSVALSAIVYRIGSWGITPNRLAVLGGNLLFLIHLILIAIKLFKSIKDESQVLEVDKAITKFLPIYAIWTVVVTFIFPLIFQFK